MGTGTQSGGRGRGPLTDIVDAVRSDYISIATATFPAAVRGEGRGGQGGEDCSDRDLHCDEEWAIVDWREALDICRA